MVNDLQTAPCLAIDGSNENDDDKLYPLTVRYFDSVTGIVCTLLLKLCVNRAQSSVEIFSN